MCFSKQLAVMDKFDFVEIFNACETPYSNRRAEALAKVYQKAGFGGSDAHRISCVGLAYTELPDSIRRESDLIAYVKKSGKLTCGGSYFRGTTKRKLGRLNYFWLKIFWIYNRTGSILKYWSRRAEVRRLR